MYYNTFAIALLLCIFKVNASATEDESYEDTVASCRSFAAQFDNTCSDLTTSQDFDSLETADVTCQTVGACAGTVSGQNCTWTRKLCISCFKESGVVRVRAQTNGLPNHCYSSPVTAPAEVEFDYTVNWLSDTTNTTYEEIATQDELDSAICNIMRSQDTNIPSTAGYEKASGTGAQNTAWGIATTGVMLFNGVSAEGVDPYYPSVYGTVTDPDAVLEQVDWCLAHPQAQGSFHYHTASTCQADASYINNTDKVADYDIVEIITEAFSESLAYRSVLGLAKDGRPIYTPFRNNGKSYADCNVDICNGKMIGGYYSYVSTIFHPYIMGCFGPGSNLEIYQSCSTNPRLCGIEYGAQDGAQIGFKFAVGSAAALISMIYF